MYVEIGNSKVKKTFMENPTQSLNHHRKIYKMLEEKKVYHTDALIKAEDNYIITRPAGDPRPPNTGKAAYNAIVCTLRALMVGVFLIYG